MHTQRPGEVTLRLDQSQRGDRDALDRLNGLVELELGRLARRPQPRCASRGWRDARSVDDNWGFRLACSL